MINVLLKLLFKGVVLGFGMVAGIKLALYLLTERTLSWEGLAQGVIILMIIGTALFGRLVYVEYKATIGPKGRHG